MEIDHEWPVNLNVRGACHSVAGIGTATVLGDLLVAETFHARTSRLCRSLHSNTGSTWQRSGGDLFGDRVASTANIQVYGPFMVNLHFSRLSRTVGDRGASLGHGAASPIPGELPRS